MYWPWVSSYQCGTCTLFRSEWVLKKSYSLGRFEYFVLAIVIGGIATIALKRYLFLVDETRNLRFEMLAHHFAKGAANARISWVVQQHVQGSAISHTKSTMMLGEQLFYFSRQGWPVSVAVGGVPGKLRYTDCYNLWQALLQNPPPIADDFDKKGNYEYRLEVYKDACRYYWNKDGNQNYYFDYHPWEGDVKLVIPEKVKSAQ